MATLYILQLWCLPLTAQSARRASTELTGVMPGGRKSLDQPAPAPPAVPAELRAPTAKTVPFFELDAAPETLVWQPQTISVVLPCAEEREYAVNTVKAVFETTPPSVLHEIVVVDDGSRPPISEKYLTPEVCKQYRVKILRHETTLGLIGSKKAGGDAASGDIVVFFDCHVAPQPNYYEDFLQLIGENYRRMVVPQITSLDVDTWKQITSGSVVSKCYVTWNGDFLWGGSEGRFMAMLSGGLAGMSKRWWEESGGFDDQMKGWGGENIDQGVRTWLCGGEIVAAPRSQVAHMWRTSDSKTKKRYKRVGSSVYNRGRAVFAWFGEFAEKAYDYPIFKRRKDSGGEHWYGDMKHFDDVKARLQGCRPFAWYLRRFSGIYLDAGIVPAEIFMLRESSTGMCLRFMGRAGTSRSGNEYITLASCDLRENRFSWHLGNRVKQTGRCCSGFRAWNTDQCLAGSKRTAICDIAGGKGEQHWRLQGGQLRQGPRCLGPEGTLGKLIVRDCIEFVGNVARFRKEGIKVPMEMQLYQKSLQDHPDMFATLDEQFPLTAAPPVPAECADKGACSILVIADGSGQCLDEAGTFTLAKDGCAPMVVGGSQVRSAGTKMCLDNWLDGDPKTWGFYACHGRRTQRFQWEENHGLGRVLCDGEAGQGCFKVKEWPAAGMKA